MTVELIYDPDCPNAELARANLRKACQEASAPAQWTEWDRSSPVSPAHVRGFGSPTILVEGQDVAGATASGEMSCCRLYGSPGAYEGAPSVALITTALQGAMASAPTIGAWKQSLFAVPGALVSMLPFGGCPACWPVYAGVLSALGLGFLLSSAYLLALTAAFLAIAVLMLLRRGRERWGYGPFALGLLAAALVLAGKFALASDALTYSGVGLLVLSSVWNAWPRRVAASCPKCAPSASGLVQLGAQERSS